MPASDVDSQGIGHVTVPNLLPSGEVAAGDRHPHGEGATDRAHHHPEDADHGRPDVLQEGMTGGGLRHQGDRLPRTPEDHHAGQRVPRLRRGVSDLLRQKPGSVRESQAGTGVLAQRTDLQTKSEPNLVLLLQTATKATRTERTLPQRTQAPGLNRMMRPPMTKRRTKCFGMVYVAFLLAYLFGEVVSLGPSSPRWLFFGKYHSQAFRTPFLPGPWGRTQAFALCFCNSTKGTVWFRHNNRSFRFVVLSPEVRGTRKEGTPRFYGSVTPRWTNTQ